MMSSWQYIPLCIGNWQLSELECRFDISFSHAEGWHLHAVHVEIEGGEVVKVRRDGTVLDGNQTVVSPLAQSIIASAACHFDENRNEILAEQNVLESA